MAKIVVLEDDASTRRLIVSVLQKAGHQVSDMDNGAEGLLTVLAELPDLVVSDIEMPKINGFEVLSDIRSTPETANTPVILLTSLSSQSDIQQGLSRGANEYLIKPLNPAQLLKAVDKHLAATAESASSQPSSEEQPAREAVELTLMPLGATRKIAPPQAAKVTKPPVVRPTGSEDRYAHLPRRAVGMAWALSLELQNHPLLKEALPLQAWRALLRQLFLPVSKDAALRSADFIDLGESRVLLYFVDEARAGVPGFVRAGQAVQALLRSGARAAQWANDQLQDFELSSIRALTSLHLGPIEVVRLPLEYGGERDCVVGPTAQLMHHLREGEPQVFWRAMGTAAALAASPHTYRLGAQLDVLAGNQEVSAHALLDLNPAYRLGEALQASDWV